MNSRTIGIFIPNIQKVGRHEYLDTLCKRAAEYDFKTMCFSSYTDFYNHDDFDKGEESIYHLAKYADLAAIVIYSELIKDDNVVNMLIEFGNERNIPVFTIEKKFEGTYFIGYSYDRAFEKITDHVIEEHGARNIYMISGIEGNSFSMTRNEAYRRSLEKHGIPFDESKIYYGEFWELPTRKVLNRILDYEETLPDAIVCANDIMAITVCNALSDRGIFVPNDIIVTGFDGIERATQNYPTITTSKYNYISSANYIIDVINNICSGAEIEPCDCIFDIDLQQGQSCGCVDLLQCTTGKITSQLYELMSGRQDFRTHMDHMTLSYNNAEDIADTFAKLDKYIPTVVYTGLAIYLDPTFFGVPACTSDGAFSTDNMVLAAYVSRNDAKYYAPFTPFDKKRLYSEEIFNGCTSLLFVPLHCQDRVYGYVVSDYNFVDLMAGERLSDFVVHMNMLLLSIENASKLKDTVNALNNMYIRDPLTNLLNRRGFYREIDMLIYEATQKKTDILLVSVDLDGLKYINDTFGHSEGDFAIVSIANLLTSVTANNGICARFGGDEYLAAIFRPENIEEFERSFLDGMKKINENSGKSYTVNASYGLELITSAEAHNSLQDAIRRADDNMFKNKKKSKFSRSRRCV